MKKHQLFAFSMLPTSIYQSSVSPFIFHTEQIMEKRNDMADLISKNAKTDLLTDRPEDVCPSSEAPRCRTPAHRSALHRTLARCPQT